MTPEQREARNSRAREYRAQKRGARALCEQTAQHPEPPELARHLAAELVAELPVAALLDAARHISSPALSHMLAVLSRGAKLMDGRPIVLETEPLDEATAAALAPLLEAAQLLAVLGNLTAAPV
jgi:hypothetical protein